MEEHTLATVEAAEAQGASTAQALAAVHAADNSGGSAAAIPSLWLLCAAAVRQVRWCGCVRGWRAAAEAQVIR